MNDSPKDALALAEQRRAEALQRIDPTLTWEEALALARELPIARQAG